MARTVGRASVDRGGAAGSGGSATGRPAASREPTDRKWSPGRNPWDFIPGTRNEERIGPALAPFVWALIGYGMHRWATPAGVGAVAVLAAANLICGALLARWAYVLSAGRRELVRAHITMSIAVGGATLTGWTVLGLSRPWVDVYGYGGFVFAATWIIPSFAAVRGYGGDEHGGRGVLDGILDGARSISAVEQPESREGRRSYVIHHPGAETEQLQKGAGVMASHGRLPRGGARVGHGVDASSSTLVIVDRDHLSRPTFWPGPSSPNGTIRDPLRVGVVEDGTDLTVTWPGDPAGGPIPPGETEPGPRQNARRLTGGAPGSGKTSAAVTEVGEVMTRRDVVLWWADTDKPFQTTPNFRLAIDWLASDLGQVGAMVHALVEVVTARAELLGSLGYQEWEPECYTKHGVPYLIAHFEEAASLSSHEEEMEKVARTVRSAGIGLSLSYQRPSSMTMSTDLRAMFDTRICFGVERSQDVQFVLSEDTIDAGAAPDLWGSGAAGKCYAETTHHPRTDWPFPARVFRTPPYWTALLCRRWAPYMAELDATSRRAAGPAYAQRASVSVREWDAAMAQRFADPARQGEPGWPAPPALGDPTGIVGTPPGSRGITAARGSAGSDPGDCEVFGSDPAPGEDDGEDQHVDGTSSGSTFGRTGMLDEIEPESSLDDTPAGEDMAPDFDPEDDMPAMDRRAAAVRFNVGTDPAAEVAHLSRAELATARAELVRSILVDAWNAGERVLTTSAVRERFNDSPLAVGLTPQAINYRLHKIEATGVITEQRQPDGQSYTPTRWALTAGVIGSELAVPTDAELAREYPPGLPPADDEDDD